MRDSPESSAAREDFVERLVTRLVLPGDEDIPPVEFSPGVVEPYRSDVRQIDAPESGDLKELVSAFNNAGPDVGLEVRFADGARSNRTAARDRVMERLQVPDPALGWRCPNDVLASISASREEIIERLAGRLGGLEDEGMRSVDLPSGVVELHRPESGQIDAPEPGDLEAILSAFDNAGPEVGSESRIADGSCSDRATLRGRVVEWLQVPNSVLGWRCPNDILATGDQLEREGLFEYLSGVIAGVEYGIFS